VSTASSITSHQLAGELILVGTGLADQRIDGVTQSTKRVASRSPVLGGEGNEEPDRSAVAFDHQRLPRAHELGCLITELPDTH
jgi:hypothetical protein